MPESVQASIIVTASLEADERSYTDVYEYCTRCGACTRRCPVQAIRMETGKDHETCGQHLKRSEEKMKAASHFWDAAFCMLDNSPGIG